MRITIILNFYGFVRRTLGDCRGCYSAHRSISSRTSSGTAIIITRTTDAYRTMSRCLVGGIKKLPARLRLLNAATLSNSFLVPDPVRV